MPEPDSPADIASPLHATGAAAWPAADELDAIHRRLVDGGTAAR